MAAWEEAPVVDTKGPAWAAAPVVAPAAPTPAPVEKVSPLVQESKPEAVGKNNAVGAFKQMAELQHKHGQELVDVGNEMVKNPSLWNAGALALTALGTTVSPLTDAIQAFAVSPSTTAARVDKKYDEFWANSISMALPLATGVKGVAEAAKALPKVVQYALGTAGKIPQAVAPSNVVSGLSDILYTMKKGFKADQVETIEKVKQFAKSNPTYKQEAENLFYASEEKGFKLSPAAQQMKAQFVDPLLKETLMLREQIRGLGLDVGEDVKGIGYMHRVPKDIGEHSLFETISGVSPQQLNSLSKFASALQERTAFKIVDGKGWEYVATRDPDAKTFQVWKNGKVVGGNHKYTTKEWDEGTLKVGGVEGRRIDATTREIETHTPIRYYHDPIGSLIDAKTRLSEVYAHAKFLSELTKAPEFDNIAVNAAKVKPGSIPKDWRSVDGLPMNFATYRWKPEIAEVLDDFIGKNTRNNPYQMLGKASRFITGSLFWNPLPHEFNVLDHAVVQKGLFGFFNPLKIPMRAETGLQAIKAVWNRDDTYLRFAREGAGIMSPDIFTKDFAKQIMTTLGNKPEMNAVAKAWGYLNPAAMVKGVYRASQKNLWAVNDVIMIQAYLEKEASGLGAQAAIKEVEKHIPNYRVPSRVAFSRAVSQGLQNPAITAFGRYEYGRMASYGNMVRDALGPSRSLSDRAHAVDQMAMLYFMSQVAYPMLADPIAKAVTGNRNATANRFGANAIPFWMTQYFHNDKSLSQVVGSTFLEAPALKITQELVSNKDLFTGQPLMETPTDAMKFMMDQVPPVKDIHDIATGKQSPGQFAAKTVGIKSPTDKQVIAREVYKKRDATRLKNKRKKQGYSE
jgi:hypothetical protein